MASSTVAKPITPVESVIRNLRAIRTFIPGLAHILDEAHETEAHHALLLAGTELDDCLTALGADPEQPTQVLPRWEPTIEDDIRQDRQMDVDHEDFDRGES